MRSVELGEAGVGAMVRVAARRRWVAAPQVGGQAHRLTGLPGAPLALTAAHAEVGERLGDASSWKILSTTATSAPGSRIPTEIVSLCTPNPNQTASGQEILGMAGSFPSVAPPTAIRGRMTHEYRGLELAVPC